MNLAFNRPRPSRRSSWFLTRRETKHSVQATRVATAEGYSAGTLRSGVLLRAYQVVDGMINDLEAHGPGFANDLLNVKMETFAHSRR